jgi:hypothetical protein
VQGERPALIPWLDRFGDEPMAAEGWQMRESQYLKSFEDRGEQKGALKQSRADLLEGLQIKLQGTAPEPIRLAIEGTNDLATLNRWFRAVLSVNSWDEFQQSMRQP